MPDSKRSQPLGGIFGQINQIIFGGQQKFQTFADVRFVINDQNATLFGRADAVRRQKLDWEKPLLWLYQT